MQKVNTKGFTLVELIVVITIVGILSTIGFVSYSSYLTGARDSNRISQMVKLSDSLQVYSATRSLPLPDNNIQIEASGSLIAYQGEVGVDVLETIDFTNGGRDPKDDSFYTYYLTKDRNSLQLMGFMEEQQSVTQLSSIQINTTHAIDNTDRFPKVYGKKLGVLLEVDTNTPVHQLSDIVSQGYIDVVTETGSYNAIFSDDIIIQGNGIETLLFHTLYAELEEEKDTSLLMYFDFDQDRLIGKSKNKLTGSFEGGSDFAFIDERKAVYFPGANEDRINLGVINSIAGGITDFTASSWTKLDIEHGNRSYNYHILGNELFQSHGFEVRIGDTINPSTSGQINFRTSTSGGVGSTVALSGSYPNDMEWHHLAFVKEGGEGRIYLNGEELSYITQGVMPDYETSSDSLALGAFRASNSPTQNFNGYLDDMRFYNRALSDIEIRALYGRTKE